MRRGDRHGPRRLPPPRRGGFSGLDRRARPDASGGDQPSRVTRLPRCPSLTRRQGCLASRRAGRVAQVVLLVRGFAACHVGGAGPRVGTRPVGGRRRVASRRPARLTLPYAARPPSPTAPVAGPRPDRNGSSLGLVLGAVGRWSVTTVHEGCCDEGIADSRCSSRTGQFVQFRGSRCGWFGVRRSSMVRWRLGRGRVALVRGTAGSGLCGVPRRLRWAPRVGTRHRRLVRRGCFEASRRASLLRFADAVRRAAPDRPPRVGMPDHPVGGRVIGRVGSSLSRLSSAGWGWCRSG